MNLRSRSFHRGLACSAIIIILVLFAIARDSLGPVTLPAGKSPAARQILFWTKNSPSNPPRHIASASEASADDQDSECYSPGSQPDPCAFVKENCDSDGFLNYLEFRYCHMNSLGLPGICYFLLVFWLFLLISLLASTADYFFVPSLQYLSDTLRLSPSVAGLTLLAFGNGAPDIFTAIAALDSTKKEDFPLVLGGLTGASLFISSVILGAVLLCAKQQQGHSSLGLDRVSFLRDIFVYLLAICLIIGISLSGSISLWQSSLFLLFYLLYIGIIILHSKYKKKYSRENQQRRRRFYSAQLSTGGDGNLLQENGENIRLREFPSSRGLAASEEVENAPITQFVALGDEENHSSAAALASEDSSDSLNSGIRDILHAMQSEEDLEEENNPDYFIGVSWPQSGDPLELIQLILQWPFTVLRWLSGPPADGKWSYRRRLLWCGTPIFFTLTLLIAVKGFSSFSLMIGNSSFPLMALLFPLTIGISGLFYRFTQNDRIPPFYSLLSIISFSSAILWLNFFASECVSLLQSFGILLDISTSLLGLTVLAIGNSIGDLVADTAVARAGMAATSISACFGSPLLNDVFGLGISLTLRTIQQYPEAFEFSLRRQIYCAWSFLLFTIISSAIIFPFSHYNPPKWFAWGLIGIYGLFLLFTVLIETNVM